MRTVGRARSRAPVSAAGNRDRILEVLRHASRPLDDDELARRAGISPRQTANQICRTLKTEGVLRRYTGQDGKIVNEWLRDATRRPAAAPTAPASVAPPAAMGEAADDALPPGSSREQREAERHMLYLVAAQLGCSLNPARITVPSGARVEIDGASDDHMILVECWAHQGPPKTAQRHKVLTDAFKLAWIASTMPARPRLILCMSDPLAARPFLPSARSWAAQALTDQAIEINLVKLPADITENLTRAQRRQYR